MPDVCCARCGQVIATLYGLPICGGCKYKPTLCICPPEVLGVPDLQMVQRPWEWD